MRNARYPENKAGLHDLDSNPSSGAGGAAQLVGCLPGTHRNPSSVLSAGESRHSGVCLLVSPHLGSMSLSQRNKATMTSQPCHFPAVDPPSKPLTQCLRAFDHTRIDDQGTTVSGRGEARAAMRVRKAHRHPDSAWISSAPLGAKHYAHHSQI